MLPLFGSPIPLLPNKYVGVLLVPAAVRLDCLAPYDLLFQSPQMLSLSMSLLKIDPLLIKLLHLLLIYILQFGLGVFTVSTASAATATKKLVFATNTILA